MLCLPFVFLPLLLTTTLGHEILYLGTPASKTAAVHNTALFNTALAQLLPGDKLIVQNHTYWVAGGIHATSLHHVTIQLDGTLKFLPGRKGWPTHVCNANRIPLQPLKNGTCVQEALFIANSSHLTFTSSGTGTVDGSGDSWWGYLKYLLHGEDRPRLFLLTNATDVLVEQWVFTQSPYWTCTFYDVLNLEISQCHISNRVNAADDHDVTNLAAFNTDGFDVAGKNIYIHDSSVWNQDDCFTIQPLDGAGYNAQCTENVLVERVNASGLGLTVGAIHPSRQHSCIKNVTFRHAHMHHTFKGIYVKSGSSFDAAASGEITNVLFENITIDTPSQVPIWIGPAQEADSKGACSLLWPSLSSSCPPPPVNMAWTNITLRNVLVKSPKQSPGIVFGNPKRPMEGVVFENVAVAPADPSKKPWGQDFYYCQGVLQGKATKGTYPVPPCFEKVNEAVIAAPTTATISVNQVDLLWARITVGGANACPENVVPCSIGTNKTRTSMESAHSLGFNVIRFAVSGFWPVDHQLWVNASTRPHYYTALDSVFEDAKRFQMQLIPSLLWNHFSFVDVCHETMSQLMRNTSSCSYQRAQEFVQTIVQRYAVKYAPQIKAWEIGNELNLLIDLNMTQQQPSIAPALGTPLKRTALDNFTTVDMMRFQHTVADKWIRPFGPHFLISSGHAFPRPSAWHVRHSYDRRQRDWTADTQQEFTQTLFDQNSGCDLISVHMYPGKDNTRWHMSASELLSFTIQTVRSQSSSNQSVYLGEFGISLPDRRNVSSSTCNFTANLLQIVRTEGILATYWVWEFEGQEHTWSIGMDGLDQRTIDELRA